MAHSKLQREHAKPVKKMHAFLQYMINGREDINYTMLTHPNWMIPHCLSMETEIKKEMDD